MGMDQNPAVNISEGQYSRRQQQYAQCMYAQSYSNESVQPKNSHGPAILVAVEVRHFDSQCSSDHIVPSWETQASICNDNIPHAHQNIHQAVLSTTKLDVPRQEMTGQTVISPTKIIQTLWSQPELPHSSLAALRLAPIEKQRLASSYKIAGELCCD